MIVNSYFTCMNRIRQLIMLVNFLEQSQIQHLHEAKVMEVNAITRLILKPLLTFNGRVVFSPTLPPTQFVNLYNL